MIQTIRQGLQANGITVSISKLCKWFEVPRRTVYYRPVKAAPSLLERFFTPIKAMIEENPSYGYRTVAHLLRSDNGLVFTSRSFTALVRSYGQQQELITPHSPVQNGLVEWVIRTLKDQCVHRHASSRCNTRAA